MFRLHSEERKITGHPPENIHTSLCVCVCVCKSLHKSWELFLTKHLTIWEMRYTHWKVYGMYLYKLPLDQRVCTLLTMRKVVNIISITQMYVHCDVCQQLQPSTFQCLRPPCSMLCIPLPSTSAAENYYFHTQYYSSLQNSIPE